MVGGVVVVGGVDVVGGVVVAGGVVAGVIESDDVLVPESAAAGVSVDMESPDDESVDIESVEVEPDEESVVDVSDPASMPCWSASIDSWFCSIAPVSAVGGVPVEVASVEEESAAGCSVAGASTWASSCPQ